MPIKPVNKKVFLLQRLRVLSQIYVLSNYFTTLGLIIWEVHKDLTMIYHMIYTLYKKRRWLYAYSNSIYNEHAEYTDNKGIYER